MSFEVEVEINGDGVKTSSKRVLSLALLCVRGNIDGIRRIAIHETRQGIGWCISKLIKPEEAREIKTIDIKVIAEPHSEGDICKKGRIEFDPPLHYVFSPLAKNRIGFKELDEKIWGISESVTGGLIDSLSTYGTILEYYEDVKVNVKEVKIYLVRDVDEIPEQVTKNRKRREGGSMKFRKKPIAVVAEQWFKHGDNPNVYETIWSHSSGNKCNECNRLLESHGLIDTLEGKHIVCPNDWIITGVKGEKYPCKPDIFEATYEKIEE